MSSSDVSFRPWLATGLVSALWVSSVAGTAVPATAQGDDPGSQDARPQAASPQAAPARAGDSANEESAEGLQDGLPDGAWLGALATGDEVVVEAATRRLTLAVSKLDPKVPLSLLGAEDAFRRAAAARLLAVRGGADEALARWAAGERSEDRLLPVLDDLPSAALRPLLTGESGAVAARALVVLYERGEAREEDLLAGMLRAGLAAAPDSEPAETVAQLLVERVVPFPEALAAQCAGSARRELLEALARRPRKQAVPFVGPLRAAPEKLEDAASRVYVVLAVPPEEWTRAEIRSLLDVLFEEGGYVGTLAADGLDQLGPRAADRLVTEVHRRAVAGEDLADLLPVLHRISAKGERLLRSLARTMDANAQGKIATWLARRGSPMVAEILGESLDEEQPISAELLRRGGAALGVAARRERVVTILRDSDDVALRTAAFEALVDAKVFVPDMLDHVSRDPSQRTRRANQLAKLPVEAAPLSVWRDLLDFGDRRISSAVYRRLAPAAADEAIAKLLASHASAADWRSEMAVAAILDAGPDALARKVWDGLPPERRNGFAERVGRREADWILPALRALPYRTPELFRARMGQGDRGLVEELLADPESFDARTLRSGDSLVAGLLRVEDGPAVVALLETPRAAQRLFALKLLAARPTLGGDAELVRIWEDVDADYEERIIALRGLARREPSRTELLASLDAAMAAGLDEEQAEAALEILGTVSDGPDDGDPPERIEPEFVRLSARLALVEPMARVEDGFADSLEEDPAFGGVAVCHAFVRTLARSEPEVAAQAVAAAVAEVRAHEDFALLARARVGRLLAFTAIEPELLETVGPVLAELVLDLPDPDPVWVGPSAWVLADLHEARGALAEAETYAQAASRAAFRPSPRPMVRRAFFGDHHPGAGSFPEAAVAARPWRIAAARAHQAGEPATTVEELLASAEELARGDREAESRVAELREVIGR